MRNESHHFGLGQVNEYHPEYGGVNWEERRSKSYEGKDTPFWFELKVDGEKKKVIQLTQENCILFLNTTAPELDAIYIHDEEHEKTYTREDLGDEVFNTILMASGNETMDIVTKYPVQHIAEAAMKLMSLDVESENSYPESWDEK